MAVSEHRSSAPVGATVRAAVVTVSDTRTPDTDEGGALVEALVARAGFRVVGRDLVRDEPEAIRDRVRDLGARVDVDVVLVTGGTGIAPRDCTVDAVTPLFTRKLDGFGELFRMLSFAEIGPAAMLSRATAGIAGDVLVFLMPGSPAGVRLALERLILPELGHLVGELRKSPPGTSVSSSLSSSSLVSSPAPLSGGATAAPDGSRSHPHAHHHHHDDRERR